ncbi:site-2 protease family protein [Eubacteriales bacterium OttesenSCG-928-K08]|nr:site-2 protease family protein [Eubacteriales bacterium OttesenSCG-928-K08]
MSILRGILNDPYSFLINMLCSLPAILIAFSFHEWAHAYSAYKLGDPTARNLGRMTVNPLRHIDPIGFATLLLFGFGWAKPVPVNPRNFKNYRKDDIIVSLAGVATNFVLAIVGVFAINLFFVFNGSNEIIYRMLIYFCSINLSLMIFNLIPIPPLDGSHVLESLLIRKVGPKPFLFLSKYGYLILIILMFTGIIGDVLGLGVSAIYSGLNKMVGGLFRAIGLY